MTSGAGSVAGSSRARIANALTSQPPVLRDRRRLVHHRDRARSAHLRADLAALAERVVEADERRALDDDGGVRAVNPAEEAVHAAGEIDGRLRARPPPGRPRLGRLVADDDASGRELARSLQRRHTTLPPGVSSWARNRCPAASAASVPSRAAGESFVARSLRVASSSAAGGGG